MQQLLLDIEHYWIWGIGQYCYVVWDMGIRWWWLVVTLVWWWLQITDLMRQRAWLTTTTTAITSNIIGVAIIIHYPSFLLTTIIRHHRKTTRINHLPPTLWWPASTTNAVTRILDNKDYYGSIIGNTVIDVPSAAGRCKTLVPWGRTWIIIIREILLLVLSFPAPKLFPTLIVSEITCD